MFTTSFSSLYLDILAAYFVVGLLVPVSSEKALRDTVPSESYIPDCKMIQLLACSMARNVVVHPLVQAVV